MIQHSVFFNRLVQSTFPSILLQDSIQSANKSSPLRSFADFSETVRNFNIEFHIIIQRFRNDYAPNKI